MRKSARALAASAVLFTSLLFASPAYREDVIVDNEKDDDIDPIRYEEVYEPEVTEDIVEFDSNNESVESVSETISEATGSGDDIIQNLADNIVKLEMAYLNGDSTIYDAYMNPIGSIPKYQKVIITRNCGNMVEIEYFDDNNNSICGYVFVDFIRMLPETFVEIDISTQTLQFYLDGELALAADVVTGHPAVSPTHEGYFQIWAKEHNVYLRGYNPNGTLRYSKYVNYWEPFDGGIGLHDAEIIVDSDGVSHGWRNTEDFGGDTYLSAGSGGCVNERNEDARFVWENTGVGTAVLVHK